MYELILVVAGVFIGYVLCNRTRRDHFIKSIRDKENPEGYRRDHFIKSVRDKENSEG